MVDHIKSSHPSFREELGIKSLGTDSNLSMDIFLTYVSAKSRNIHFWMQWVVNRNRPLTFFKQMPDYRRMCRTGLMEGSPLSPSVEHPSGRTHRPPLAQGPSATPREKPQSLVS